MSVLKKVALMALTVTGFFAGSSRELLTFASETRNPAATGSSSSIRLLEDLSPEELAYVQAVMTRHSSGTASASELERIVFSIENGELKAIGLRGTDQEISFGGHDGAPSSA